MILRDVDLRRRDGDEIVGGDEERIRERRPVDEPFVGDVVI